jgi:nitroreductase
MIAPLGQTERETVQTRRHLWRARRLVASMFLEHEPAPRDNAPPVAAWQAWVFAGWVVLVTGVYFATMVGLL